MYKNCKNRRVGGGIIITDQRAYFIEKIIDENEQIVQIDKNGIEYYRFNFINFKDVCGLTFTKEYLILTFKIGITSFYNIDNSQKCLEFNESFSFAFWEENEHYIFMKNRDFLYRFNKRLQCIEKFLPNTKSLLLRYLLKDNLIFTLKGFLLFVYKSENEDITLSWQLDMRSLFPDQEDVDINEIKEYQGSLILVTSAAVLRLSVEDGSIIWISEGYARTIEIVGNTGYVCTSGSLFKVNLDNGEESGFGWGEYHKLPNFTYNGKDYWATGHRVVYHDGLLWYSVYSSGDSFLIAINPENGNYEWIHYVDTIGKTDEPQFFGDYMFLYDTEHTLHIYQKES